MPVVRGFRNLDWQNPMHVQEAGLKLVKLFQDAGMTITIDEAQKIIREVGRNPNKARENLENVSEAFQDFALAMGE